jgi:hypothetical protein
LIVNAIAESLSHKSNTLPFRTKEYLSRRLTGVTKAPNLSTKGLTFTIVIDTLKAWVLVAD